MFDSWRFLDVRPRGGLRATWRCTGRGLPLRLYRGEGWRHNQSLLRRRRFKHRPGTRQHTRSVDLAGCAWPLQRRPRTAAATELEALLAGPRWAMEGVRASRQSAALVESGSGSVPDDPPYGELAALLPA